jgi:hypothetical protein
MPITRVKAINGDPSCGNIWITGVCYLEVPVSSSIAFLKTGIDLNPGNDQAHFVCVKMSVNEN